MTELTEMRTRLARVVRLAEIKDQTKRSAESATLLSKMRLAMAAVDVEQEREPHAR
jgi:hypothetical protein